MFLPWNKIKQLSKLCWETQKNGKTTFKQKEKNEDSKSHDYAFLNFCKNTGGEKKDHLYWCSTSWALNFFCQKPMINVESMTIVEWENICAGFFHDNLGDNDNDAAGLSLS